jgi:hypothetical protein
VTEENGKKEIVRSRTAKKKGRRYTQLGCEYAYEDNNDVFAWLEISRNS